MRPGGMAEKLAFHQGTHQRTAIDGHKLASRIGVVKGPATISLPVPLSPNSKTGRRLADALSISLRIAAIGGDWPTKPCAHLEGAEAILSYVVESIRTTKPGDFSTES